MGPLTIYFCFSLIILLYLGAIYSFYTEILSFFKTFSSRCIDVSKYLVRKMLPVMEEVIFQMIYFTIVLMRSYLILLKKIVKFKCI